MTRDSAPFANTKVVILAAGKGTRMRSSLHKVLHPVGGQPMIEHLVDLLANIGAPDPIIVVGAAADQVRAALPGLDFAEQRDQLGTGHAVACCREALANHDGDILVLYGDVPLVDAEALTAMMHQRRAGHTLVALGFEATDPRGYGRFVLAADGSLERIVEHKDASNEERDIRLCNSGLMLFDGGWGMAALDRLSNDNASGEYYLTDLVALARADGLSVGVAETEEETVIGVNDRADLAEAEALFQIKRRAALLLAGVTMTAPETVYVSADTVIAADVTLEPHIVIGPGVTIEAGATVKAFSHLEGATVKARASIGPYARLRSGTVIGDGAKIGNFVETKKADIAAGAKVSHLSYIGDAMVGANANIGAGTITCNYDGFNKYQTTIGAGAFIGSNSALVAPVHIGDGAIVGAGSTITKDVAADALGVTRASQRDLPAGAKRFRDRQKKDKS